MSEIVFFIENDGILQSKSRGKLSDKDMLGAIDYVVKNHKDLPRELLILNDFRGCYLNSEISMIYKIIEEMDKMRKNFDLVRTPL